MSRKPDSPPNSPRTTSAATDSSPPSGEKDDGGGFNGIGARWIARFMKDRKEQAAFEPWLRKNADAAWQARRESDNLCWPKWPQPTPPGTRYSWGCSSAVVLLQVTDPP